MRIRVLLVLSAPLLSAQCIAAQTLEDRVASLEAQVAELWSLHDHAYERSGMVPAELVGNEHMRWGYPGGDCAVLVNDYFITCHDNDKRIPEWVTYHLTSENVAGETERTDDFRPDPRGVVAWLGAGDRSPVPRAGIRPLGNCRASQDRSSY